MSETILRVQTISWKETSLLNDHAVVELDEQKYQNQAKTTFPVMKSNILPLIFVFFFFGSYFLLWLLHPDQTSLRLNVLLLK